MMSEHLSQSELDYPFRLLEYINGFRVSKVIFSASELGVFDLLLRSQEALSAQRVAQELGTSMDGMERLLDALVGIEILEVEVTNGTALYSSSDVANLYLAKGSSKSLHDMIIYQSQTIYPLWSHLGDAIREGKSQYEKTFGPPSGDVFQTIYRSEEEMLKFMGLMNSSWVIDGHDVVTAFNLSSFQTIVDLGGEKLLTQSWSCRAAILQVLDVSLLQTHLMEPCNCPLVVIRCDGAEQLLKLAGCWTLRTRIGHCCANNLFYCKTPRMHRSSGP
uniref:Acetylserotonin O-methyltransferase n=1 Tax=Nothobranchius furzeri TaxID=105023 RepID=A0A1A7ZLZ7_NOTFU